MKPFSASAIQDGQRFATTQWSVVLVATRGDAPRRQAALEQLCRTYWEPLYSYLRWQGCKMADAQDLTQGFFAHLLNGARLDGVAPHKGKFRSFLLASIKHFLADAQARERAAKRGGGQVVPLEPQIAESHLQRVPTPDRSAEQLFDRRWALTVLDRAFQRLQEQFTTAGKQGQFAVLSGFLCREGDAAQYQATGKRLGMSSGAVSVAVHRLRHRLRELIRAEVAQTVHSPAETDEEMRYLLELLCG